jgi:excisionase family DNA binding protein
METEILTINDLSDFLKIKKSSLYARVEKKEIPHYKIGNLIRFRKNDLDRWLDGKKIEPENIDKRARVILKANEKIDIDKLVKKTIAKENKKVYASAQGRSDRIEGLRKGVENERSSS